MHSNKQQHPQFIDGERSMNGDVLCCPLKREIFSISRKKKEHSNHLILLGLFHGIPHLLNSLRAVKDDKEGMDCSYTHTTTIQTTKGLSRLQWVPGMKPRIVNRMFKSNSGLIPRSRATAIGGNKKAKIKAIKHRQSHRLHTISFEKINNKWMVSLPFANTARIVNSASLLCMFYT